MHTSMHLRVPPLIFLYLKTARLPVVFLCKNYCDKGLCHWNSLHMWFIFHAGQEKTFVYVIIVRGGEKWGSWLINKWDVWSFQFRFWVKNGLKMFSVGGNSCVLLKNNLCDKCWKAVLSCQFGNVEFSKHWRAPLSFVLFRGNSSQRSYVLQYITLRCITPAAGILFKDME